MLINSQTGFNTINTCRQNIEKFLHRDIGNWTGLKAGCNKSDIIMWFPFIEGEGVAHYGAHNVEYVFRSLPYPGFSEGVFFYFDHHQLSFIITEFWSFEQQECYNLLQQLGEPLQRLDFYWRDEKIANGEWVYPDKGIALGIIPATQLITMVVVYPSCSLSVYKTRYYNAKLSREFHEIE